MKNINCEYIAAANPETVLKLIAVVNASKKLVCSSDVCMINGLDDFRKALADLEEE